VPITKRFFVKLKEKVEPDYDVEFTTSLDGSDESGITIQNVHVRGESVRADAPPAEELLETFDKLIVEKIHSARTNLYTDETSLFWKAVAEKALTIRAQVNARLQIEIFAIWHSGHPGTIS
jgi:hypothetical protein